MWCQQQEAHTCLPQMTDGMQGAMGMLQTQSPQSWGQSMPPPQQMHQENPGMGRQMVMQPMPGPPPPDYHQQGGQQQMDPGMQMQGGVPGMASMGMGQSQHMQHPQGPPEQHGLPQPHLTLDGQGMDGMSMLNLHCMVVFREGEEGLREGTLQK